MNAHGAGQSHSAQNETMPLWWNWYWFSDKQNYWINEWMTEWMWTVTNLINVQMVRVFVVKHRGLAGPGASCSQSCEFYNNWHKHNIGWLPAVVMVLTSTFCARVTLCVYVCVCYFICAYKMLKINWQKYIQSTFAAKWDVWVYDCCKSLKKVAQLQLTKSKWF